MPGSQVHLSTCLLALNATAYLISIYFVSFLFTIILYCCLQPLATPIPTGELGTGSSIGDAFFKSVPESINSLCFGREISGETWDISGQKNHGEIQ